MNNFLFYKDEFPSIGSKALLVRIPIGLSSKQQFLEFFAEQLRFPSYFGMNWDAFDECLSDLGWLDVPEVVLMHADVPLADAHADRRNYLSILYKVCGEHNVVRVMAMFPEKLRQTIKESMGSA